MKGCTASSHLVEVDNSRMEGSNLTPEEEAVEKSLSQVVKEAVDNL